jgi:hypothetical protein
MMEAYQHVLTIMNRSTRQEKQGFPKEKEVQGRAKVYNGMGPYVEQTSHQRYHEATRPRFQR